MNIHSIFQLKQSIASITYGLLSILAAQVAGSGFLQIHASELEPIESSRIIQYRGPMPYLPQEHWGKEAKLVFELYRSPTGGSPFWSETRRVPVRKDGWVEVNLGLVEELPDSVFMTPFRFLSIWHNDVEFIPRKQVSSVAYVASPYESKESQENYLEVALNAAKKAALKAPDRENKLDVLIDCGPFEMETHPRMPLTWLDAEKAADSLGARLPTFGEWYGAFDGEANKSLEHMAGHYEWVIPWVYEPLIHARLQELYRGKPVACYYNELSPMNEYPFRLAVNKAKEEKK